MVLFLYTSQCVGGGCRQTWWFLTKNNWLSESSPSPLSETPPNLQDKMHNSTIIMIFNGRIMQESIVPQLGGQGDTCLNPLVCTAPTESTLTGASLGDTHWLVPPLLRDPHWLVCLHLGIHIDWCPLSLGTHIDWCVSTWGSTLTGAPSP